MRCFSFEMFLLGQEVKHRNPAQAGEFAASMQKEPHHNGSKLKHIKDNILLICLQNVWVLTGN